MDERVDTYEHRPRLQNGKLPGVGSASYTQKINFNSV